MAVLTKPFRGSLNRQKIFWESRGPTQIQYVRINWDDYGNPTTDDQIGVTINLNQGGLFPIDGIAAIKVFNTAANPVGGFSENTLEFFFQDTGMIVFDFQQFCRVWPVFTNGLQCIVFLGGTIPTWIAGQYTEIWFCNKRMWPDLEVDPVS